MPIKPWYQVVYPREDLQSGRPLDASQFAVHLDKVKQRQGDPTYYKPEEFFARTFLTHNLLELAAEVSRRLSGETAGTSPAFNMATQFGGGKTHALTLLYHLAENGPRAESWPGVGLIREKAQIPSLPSAATAIFVGQNFDPRGGDDGTPHRRTPWGDIAWQLGGAEGFALFAEFDQQGNAPGGDTIGRLFDRVNRPILILVDELINYMSRYRRQGMADQLYNFLFTLSNEVASRANVVLAVSVPRSEGEMGAEDVEDYGRITHMLERLSKPVEMAVGPDTAEIIRRRLFDWGDGPFDSQGRVILNNDAVQACNAYADWVQEHRSQLPGDFPFDRAREYFRSTYPFHPVVLSVFERKWQALPGFQRTRGVLRMLALWVAHAYDEGANRLRHRGDPLLTLGMAPLDNPHFRQDVFTQLGDGSLIVPVTADIIGGASAHALRLDEEAPAAIRELHLHRKVATAIFFESNGGQSRQRAYASVPEIRLAVGQPDLDIGHVETVLEAMAPPAGVCFYLDVQNRGYWFSTKANLTQVLAQRKADVRDDQVKETVLAAVQREFGQQSRDGVARIFFPARSSDIPNQAVLTVVVLPPERSLQRGQETRRFVADLTREYGSSARTFKSALLWSVADSDGMLKEAAKTLLAWEMISDERDRLQLSDSQGQQLEGNLRDARGKLKEAVWASYQTVLLLGPGNQWMEKNLGRHNSTSAGNLAELILRELGNSDEVLESLAPTHLTRKWPPAFDEWSTQAVRDAFYASPEFPRLRSSEILKETIAKGVTNGHLAYGGRLENGRHQPFYFERTLYSADVDISDQMVILTADAARAYLAAREAAEEATEQGSQIHEGGSIGGEGRPDQPSIFTAGGDEPVTVTSPRPTPPVEREDEGEGVAAEITRLAWEGAIPAQKWSNFYMKVLARFVNSHSLRLTVRAEISSEAGISPQRVSEVQAALRELGLGDEVEVG